MKPSILIVDDEEVIQQTLFDVLKKRGYDTFTASSGKETLGILKKHIIDLILLDIRLPDVDGLEVLKKVKEFDNEILVIMMTAYADIQTAVDAMAEHQLRRMPVVDNDYKIVGIISQAAVATRVDQPEKTAKMVKEISQPMA